MIELKNVTKETPVEGVIVLIEKRQEALTKAGKPFLTLNVRDKTSSMSAKIWDYDSSKHGKLLEGSVATIWATVDEFAGSLQLNIKQIEDSLEDPTQFYKSTRFKVDDMWNDLVNVVSTFKEPLTKYVTEEILIKQAYFVEAFKKAPAAKTVHNAWFGGLLEHVHSLVTIAEPIIAHYSKRYNKPISRDKVLFGLIMHDAGKILEYDYSSPAFNLTPIGLLTPHIVIGPAWVYEKANLFYQTALTLGQSPAVFKFERAHLMHILAAHHGTQEWGSPVSPASIEAVLVHQLDMIDSKTLHAIELIEGKDGPVKGFSERSYFEKSSYMKYENQ